MADSTVDTGAHGSDDAGGSKPFKVFQTQADFDAHAAGIRAAVERKASRSATPDPELDTLRAENESLKQAELERQGKYEEAKAAVEKKWSGETEKERAKRTKAEAALRKTVIEDQLKALASVHGAYDPEDVVVRLKDRIVLDDDYQVGVRGTDAVGAVQDGVTMEQAVIDLLKAKPHLAKATWGGKGSGAAGGASLVSGYTGTPSQREAQERLAAAEAALKANPASVPLRSAYLAAQQAVSAAKVAS